MLHVVNQILSSGEEGKGTKRRIQNAKEQVDRNTKPREVTICLELLQQQKQQKQRW